MEQKIKCPVCGEIYKDYHHSSDVPTACPNCITYPDLPSQRQNPKPSEEKNDIKRLDRG